MVQHIKIMQKHGFPFTRDLRVITLPISLKSNTDLIMTLKKLDMNGFIHFSKHPDISVRKSEGLSLARNFSMNRQKVNEYLTTDLSYFVTERREIEKMSIYMSKYCKLSR